MTDQPILLAKLVARRNRFVVTAQLHDGSEVQAHLPNTGRLEQLMWEGNRLLLRRDGAPPRITQYTAIRAWDGCWVGLEANRAPQLLTRWLDEGNSFPGLGRVSDIRTEVGVDGHRLDLLLQTESGPVWVEVKSGSRAADGWALLSRTPSARGVSHLSSLGDLVGRREQAAAAFVIQRSDVASLFVGGDADQAWIDAVRVAREAGVVVTALGCDVTEADVVIDRVLPVIWD